jgi:hypothetical protein
VGHCLHISQQRGYLIQGYISPNSTFDVTTYDEPSEAEALPSPSGGVLLLPPEALTIRRSICERQHYSFWSTKLNRIIDNGFSDSSSGYRGKFPFVSLISF